MPKAMPKAIHIHICLVSAQAQPNLIPILMEKPDEVCMIISEQAAKNADDVRLYDAIKLGAPHITLANQKSYLPLVDYAPALDISDVEAFASALLDQLSAANHTVTLNLTGGTKLMALGFYNVFRNMLPIHPNWRIIYCNTELDRLDNLVSQSHEDLAEVLTPELYAAAQGARLTAATSDAPAWRDRVKKRKALTEFFAFSAPVIGDAITLLNQAGIKASKDKDGTDAKNLTARCVHPIQNINKNKHVSDTQWQAICGVLTRALQAGVLMSLTINEASASLEFKDVDRSKYLSGLWLEEWLWLNVCALHPSLEAHTLCSAKLSWTNYFSNKYSKNEFDLAICLFNRLFVIECKTGMDAIWGDMIDRLTGVTRSLSGLFGKILFVSLQPPSESLLAHLERSKIQYISGADIIDPKPFLQKFLSS